MIMILITAINHTNKSMIRLPPRLPALQIKQIKKQSQTEENLKISLREEITPERSDNHNYYYIERHLFYEVVSNITVGLADDNYIPLSLQEQKMFFKRADVRAIMKHISIEFLKQLRADEKWTGGIEND